MISLYLLFVLASTVAAWLAVDGWWFLCNFDHRPVWLCEVDNHPSRPRALMVHVPYAWFIVRLERKPKF